MDAHRAAQTRSHAVDRLMHVGLHCARYLVNRRSGGMRRGMQIEKIGQSLLGFRVSAMQALGVGHLKIRSTRSRPGADLGQAQLGSSESWNI